MTARDAEAENSTVAPPEQGPKRSRFHLAVSGFILGLLIGIGGAQLGSGAIPVVEWFFAPPIAGLIGMAVGLSRRRRLLWAFGLLEVAMLLVLSYTPLAPVLMHGIVEKPGVGSAPAVVVLSSDIFENGEPNGTAHLRLLRAFELIQQGSAQHLVMTQLPSPAPSYEPSVQRQLRSLRISATVVALGRVANTHDEAVLVSALAREREWDKVLLVSQPWHMRRAAAAFRKAGIAVIEAPCVEGSYDLESLAKPGDRLHAFRDWLHEVIGMQVYRMRGWI